MYKQEKIKPKKKKKKIKRRACAISNRETISGWWPRPKDSGLVVYPADEKRRGDYYHRFVINSVSPREKRDTFLGRASSSDNPKN